MLKVVFSNSADVCFADEFDFITDTAEYRFKLFLCALEMRGVIEGPVVTIDLAWKDGADLVDVSANCDHGCDFVMKKFREVFGAGCREVKAEFLHDLDGHGMHEA